MILNEKMLQFILEHNYYDDHSLITTCKKEIKIIFLGYSNQDQGPDYTYSRVLIDKVEWVGTIELHVNTSDWLTHRHHLDPNYKSVVLHIVWNHDVDVFNQSPVLELKNHIKSEWHDAFWRFQSDGYNRPCKLYKVKSHYSKLFEQLTKLGHDRLFRKANAILNELRLVRGDWDEVVWRIVARNFGYRVNAEAFYQMATSIGYNLIRKFKNDPHLIESLLLGQSGLLEREYADEYPNRLKLDYLRIKKDHFLKSQEFSVHFLRMRPHNFPTIRLSQLASFLSSDISIFEHMRKSNGILDVLSDLRFSASSYWDTHFVFDKVSPFLQKKMGTGFVSNILLNSVIPLMIAYGLSNGSTVYIERALQMVKDMPFEKNAKVNTLRHLVEPMNALESQSIIELYDAYCSAEKCSICPIMNGIRGMKS